MSGFGIFAQRFLPIDLAKIFCRFVVITCPLFFVFLYFGFIIIIIMIRTLGASIWSRPRLSSLVAGSRRDWSGTKPARAAGIQTSFDLPDPAVRQHGQPSHSSRQLTKIVATIGPTSEQAQPLLDVTRAGMRIMRLNFSHATPEEVELRTTNLQAAQVSRWFGSLLGGAGCGLKKRERTI